MKFIVNESILRVALIACNFVFAILSVAIIALGVIYSDKLWYMRTYVGEDFVKFPAVLIILGCLSFATSLAGCYCARSTNRRFYIVFLIILICLLGLDLCLSVIAFMNIDASKESEIVALMSYQIGNKSSREDFHDVEDFLKCCGINGVTDYLKAHNRYKNERCCGLPNCTTELIKNTTNIEFKRGCSQKVTEEIRQIAVEASSFISVYTMLQVMEIVSLSFLQEFMI